MRVCDRCKAEGVETVRFKNKDYELCERCSERIYKFLNTKEQEGMIQNLFK